MLFCCISTDDMQWEVHGLWEAMPQGNLTFFACLWLFSLEAVNDLKRALFCFGNGYFIGIFCSV